jgi:anti-sigma regulatory factor (Ser/Thr protein kinase)
MTGNETEVRLEYEPEAVATAREAVRHRLGGSLSRDRVDEAVLITDELVTNAIRHASPERDGRIGLRFDITPTTVRIVVTDGSARFEWTGRDRPGDLAGGFGLVLVDEIADRWGLSLDGKKAVWFELDRSGEA